MESGLFLSRELIENGHVSGDQRKANIIEEKDMSSQIASLVIRVLGKFQKGTVAFTLLQRK